MRQFAMLCNIEFRLFVRDFFSFFFALVFPVLMLLLFGGIFGNAPVYDGADMGIMDVTVPAYAVMVTGVTGLMSLPLTLSGYKEKKIYKRFDATPVGKKNIISAQILINFVMTLVGISILLAAGKILYHIQINGDFLSICVGIFLSIGAMFSMGFFLTAIGRDLKSTNMLCYLIYFVMLFLSGATMPDQMFSHTMKKLSSYLPMTHAVDLMQGIFSGDSLILHKRELLILGILAMVCTSVGAVLYRRKDWT